MCSRKLIKLSLRQRISSDRCSCACEGDEFGILSCEKIVGGKEVQFKPRRNCKNEFIFCGFGPILLFGREQQTNVPFDCVYA